MIPPQMRQRYPDEMAIILQHEFWDLAVGQDGFEVSLNFSRKPERLSVPFDSITGFSDPSVPFGFKLEPRLTAPEEPAREVAKPVRALGAAQGAGGQSSRKNCRPGDAVRTGQKGRKGGRQTCRGCALEDRLDRRVPEKIAAEMAEIINLRRERKRKSREADAAQADAKPSAVWRPEAGTRTRSCAARACRARARGRTARSPR